MADLATQCHVVIVLCSGCDKRVNFYTSIIVEVPERWWMGRMQERGHTNCSTNYRTFCLN